MTTNQTAPVTDEELDQMIWKLERDGMTPKMLSLMRELREVRREKGEPVAYADPQSFINFKSEGGKNAACTKEWMWRDSAVGLIPLYTAPPAPVVPSNVADAIESLKQRLADCHRFNYCAEAVREVEDATRIVMLQAGNSRGIPDEQSFWNWLRKEMPTTYRWSRELEDTPENSALITKGKASALDMLSAWKGCSAAMLNHFGDAADMVEPVSNRDELNSPATPDGISESGEDCWACGKYFTYEQHSECDGYCPHCGSPVDLDDDEDQSFKVVPTEPTEEMISNAWREAVGKCDHETIKRIYATMLAAAPKEVG